MEFTFFGTGRANGFAPTLIWNRGRCEAYASRRGFGLLTMRMAITYDINEGWEFSRFACRSVPA